MDNPGFQNDELGAMPRLARPPSDCRVHAPAPAAPATPSRVAPGYLRFGGGGGAQPQSPTSPTSTPAPAPAAAPSPQGHGLRELLGRLQLPAAASPDPKKAADASPLSTVSAIVAKTFPPSPLHKAAALMSQPSPRPSLDNRRNLRRSGRGAGDPLSEARLSKRRGPLGAAWKLSFAAGAGNPFHHHSHNHNQQAPHAAGWRNALLGAAVLIAAALASLVVAGAWLYMYTAPPSHTSMGPERVFDAGEGVSVVAGEFRITNEEFAPELSDPSSEDFSQLSMQISRQLDELFGRSGLSGRYNGSAVPSLEAARPSGVLVRCRLLLLSPEPEPGLAGVEFLRGLRHRRGRMWLGDFAIDVQSIGFQAESEPEDSQETTTDADLEPAPPPPQWSAWSEWSACSPAAGPSRSQSRSRLCVSAAGAPLQDIEPCLLAGGGGDLEARDCPDQGPRHSVMAASVFEEPPPPPDEVVVMDLSAGNDARHCDECRPGEVCVALGSEALPLCRTPSDPSDPTGCGGLCQLGTEVCYKLDIDAFRCIDDSFCLPSEWQCANQLCIPEVKRCDGHMNCYDHTDEYDCECNLESNFHCGNGTSCLPTRKKCDGVIDCWDGSDELSCTIACPSPQEFTCTDGQCIPRSQFCDGYADCRDRSDEPFGCGGECKSHEWECNNGRCIMREEVCDGEDTCGDLSDEKNCPHTTTDQS